MNAPEAKGLVFSGREPGLIPWTLLGFILLSACVHAFGFFIFQTIYPAAARMAPPPAQVGFLAPGTPEADAILRWIDSEDPALAAVPRKAPPVPDLMTLPYIPSYSGGKVHTRPTMSPPPEQPLPYPDGVSGLDLVEVAAPPPAPSTPPPPPAATTLSFSGTLTPIGPLPSFSALHEPEIGELRPASFLLGVSDRGEVRYVFLQDSSGNQALDAGATTILQQVRFRPSATPLTWGFATFHWGSAVFAQTTPEPEASP